MLADAFDTLGAHWDIAAPLAVVGLLLVLWKFDEWTDRPPMRSPRLAGRPQPNQRRSRRVWSHSVERSNARAGGKYSLEGLLASGGLADIYRAHAPLEGAYVVKIAKASYVDPLLKAEAERLNHLFAVAGNLTYRQYLPQLVETCLASGPAGMRRANVFAWRDGFYTLTEVRNAYPQGLDARHLGWIFKRTLTAIGFAHNCGLVHGAVLPSHLMLHANNHGLQLLDWTHAVALGGSVSIIPEAYCDWYPPEVRNGRGATAATDVYLSAKSLIYAAGGDPVNSLWPESVPPEMQAFMKPCLHDLQHMRPDNAWRLHDRFDALLQQLFGRAQYHQLTMPSDLSDWR